MSGVNKKRFNLWRRGIGLLLGLLPLFLLLASIIFGVVRSPQPKFAAIGWMFAAAVFAVINFYLSFLRPPLLLYIFRVPRDKYKNVSGLPMIGSVLICIGALFGFGSIGNALTGLIIFAFDTGGSIWFLIATWKDRSLWDR